VTSAGSSAVTSGVEPRPGNVYLVEERRPKASYEIFDQAVSSGFNGLVVTRDYPKKLLSEKDLGTSRIIWLTNLVGEARINPTAIGILMGQIRNFIETQGRTAVILDGLEYLISLNTYDRMLQFMHQLKDVVVTNECVFVVPVDTRTTSQRELALLERCMEPVVPKSESESSEDSMIHSQEDAVLRMLDVGPR